MSTWMIFLSPGPTSPVSSSSGSMSFTRQQIRQKGLVSKGASGHWGGTMASLASQDRPFPMHGGEFVAMMAMLMALQALCIDAMLPALGSIAADMGVHDPNRRQLVVGIYLLAGGFGALVPGSLADR